MVSDHPRERGKEGGGLTVVILGVWKAAQETGILPGWPGCDKKKGDEGRKQFFA